MLNAFMNSVNRWLLTIVVLVLSCPVGAFAAEQALLGGGDKPWWYWPIILFVFCFGLGILAVMAGVGGGVLYVP
ncbi:MAG: hypothetical protein KAH09_03240, partial [Desulfobacula sp.]|nr:hypothetical protein [Desulfobacula sp.]